MADSFNRVTFIGNIGKAPDMKYSANGVPVTTFSLAVSVWNARDKSEDTIWVNFVCFNKRAEFVNTWCQKGTQIAVEGRLKAVRPFKYNSGELGASLDIIHDERDNFQILARKRQAQEEDTTPASPEEIAAMDLDTTDFTKPF